MDLLDDRSEEVKKKLKARNSIFAIDMQQIGYKGMQTLEKAYTNACDLFDRGAPTSRVMIISVCVFLTITILGVVYSASGYRTKKQIIDEYDLTNETVPIFTREWPLPPPYISPPVSPKLLMNVLTSLHRSERPRNELCVFPAAYTIPWDLMHVRETNRTYVSPRFVFGGAGTAMRIESANHARHAYAYMRPIANMTYERAFMSVDGETFSEEKGGELSLEKELAYCVQMYTMTR